MRVIDFGVVGDGVGSGGLNIDKRISRAFQTMKSIVYSRIFAHVCVCVVRSKDVQKMIAIMLCAGGIYLIIIN